MVEGQHDPEGGRRQHDAAQGHPFDELVRSRVLLGARDALQERALRGVLDAVGHVVGYQRPVRVVQALLTVDDGRQAPGLEPGVLGESERSEEEGCGDEEKTMYRHQATIARLLDGVASQYQRSSRETAS